MQDQALSEGSTLTTEEAAGRAGHAGPGVVFAAEDERDAASAALERSGMVVVELEGIGPSRRGRLAEAIDEALEGRLAARGAAAPGITSGSDRDATLSDQLFRARQNRSHRARHHPRTAAGADRSARRPRTGGLRHAALPRQRDARTPDRPGARRAGSRHRRLRRSRGAVAAADARHAASHAGRSDRACPCPRAPRARRPRRARTAPGRRSRCVGRVRSRARVGRAGAAGARSCPGGAGAGGRSRCARPRWPPWPHRHTAGASLATSDDRWRTWTLQLAAARGPQPLATRSRSSSPRATCRSRTRSPRDSTIRGRATPTTSSRRPSRRATARRSPPSPRRPSARGWCSTPTTSPRASLGCTARARRA